ncbi:hypothetical protein QBC34DRAFT_28495 [Podospora aff. communis PSN243]|uniref:Rhodopsin domain-containing protein n=1 Tax=Podospora aff. communis PSN243 TaxID=3040156 RepID=A0AAV9H1E1_9PEZI|nr:hypothetical protein QBC34DRAFT_28495 [Podospora aff. communis PSN243]
MADAISSGAHTKFNISGPGLPFNASGVAVEAEPPVIYREANIPGILFGILVPHTVCTLFILARGWSRIALLRKWFLDDTLIVAAWAFSTTVCVIYSIAAQAPRVASSTTYDRSAAVRIYLGLICYQLCLCITKLSILAFYLRIFTTRLVERRLAWATIIGVLLYGIPLLFMTVFQCHPVAGRFFSQPMRCFTFEPLLIVSASLHTAVDAWMIALIIPCVTRLDLPRQQKIALSGVLSLGVFVIAASLARLQFSLARARDNADGVPVTNSLAFFVMTILELDLALICATAPTLRLALARLWPRLGMGEPVPGGGVRRRPLSASQSVDLTSVVSYHGYPWTQPGTPANRSKNPSLNNVAGPRTPAGGASASTPPVPPLAVIQYRAPTTLSLKSFMSKNRGQPSSSAKEGDKTVLLGSRPATQGDAAARRSSRSTIGFEGYFDNDPSFNNDGGEKKRNSRLFNLRAGCDSRRSSMRYSYSERYSGRWGESQESFVLGVNDPNSPSRLSPVSDSRLSALTQTASLGEAVEEGRGVGSQRQGEVHGQGQTQGQSQIRDGERPPPAKDTKEADDVPRK